MNAEVLWGKKRWREGEENEKKWLVKKKKKEVKKWKKRSRERERKKNILKLDMSAV